MGTGTIVIGLASVIIGEVLFGTRSFKNCLISVILGSIVYRLVIAIVLQLGMPPNASSSLRPSSLRLRFRCRLFAKSGAHARALFDLMRYGETNA